MSFEAGKKRAHAGGLRWSNPCLARMQEKGHIMTTTTLETNAMRACLRLTPDHRLMLKNAAGVLLTPLSGRAWLTMEGDPRDIDLRPGMPYTIERDGLTLVNAFEPGVLRVSIPRARVSAWRRWVAGIWDLVMIFAEARAQARLARVNRHLW